MEGYDAFKHEGRFRHINETGAARFGALGFPAKKHEMFTFVNLREFLAEKFEHVEGPEKMPSKDEIKPFVYAGCENSLVVLVDGRFSAALSDMTAHDGNASATELDEGNPALDVHAENDVFASINALFLTGGVKIEVTNEGAQIGVPIQVLHISTAQARSAGKVPAYSPRIVVNLPGDAKARIAVKYCGLGKAYFVNTVTDLVLGEGAELDVSSVQGDPASAWHFSKTTARQKKNSRLGIVGATTGGRLVRHNFDLRLEGEGAALSLLSLAILDGAEQSHNYVRVTHDAPGCKSFEHYKNILRGRSVSSVDTTVTVNAGAQLAVSEQLVNNLMFSSTARADTKPRLMIRADDVKCKHGATVGRIDEAQIFYLVSRGLSEKAAKALIISGFAKGVLNAMPNGPISADAESLLLNKLGE